MKDEGVVAEEERQRFRFGQNWSSFLRSLTDGRLEIAKQSLSEMLDQPSLDGKTFLDVGSGSGLFSLAARELGARVYSFDYDQDCVQCAALLRSRFREGDRDWTIEQGSILDRGYVDGLGQFDVVYSWGVLHHTGKMWEAIENSMGLVKVGGKLFISIYNDQEIWSRMWWWVKWLYCQLPPIFRPIWVVLASFPVELKYFVHCLFLGKPGTYFDSWFGASRARGMSKWHDKIDWVGGFPFEVAKPEEVFDFARARGFELVKLVTCYGSRGCNQFVFMKRAG